MTLLLVTLRSLLLLVTRLLLYMGIALLAVAAFQIALTGAAILLRHLIAL